MNKKYFVIAALSYPTVINETKFFSNPVNIFLNNHQYILGDWIGSKDYVLNKGEGLQYEPIGFCTEVNTNSMDEVSEWLKRESEYLELFLDSLSIQYLHSIQIKYLQILDVTEPCNLRNEKESRWYVKPYGFPVSAKQRFTNPINNKIIPTFSDFKYLTPGAINRNSVKALRYFVKAIESHDDDIFRFCFLWASLEIIASNKEAYTVKELPRLTERCKHVFQICPEPECNVEISKKILLGKSIKRFIQEELNAEDTLASDLWKFRQIVHGSLSLDVQSLEKLPSLLIELENLALTALKKELNMQLDKPPHILTENIDLIINYPAPYGTHTINNDDLQRLEYYLKYSTATAKN